MESNQESIERRAGHGFYPFGDIPKRGSEYDFDAYVDHMVRNLAGPLRIFRAAMLDLLHMVCVNDDQKAVARNVVFEKFKENAALLEDWVQFYGLTYDPVDRAIRDARPD